MIYGYHCTRTRNVDHREGHNINDPFAIAVYKETTARHGLGHVATIVDGNITLGSLGSGNNSLTESFLK